MTDPGAAAPLEEAPGSDDRVLVIKAKGGLGNRMLSAVTGLIYADLARRRPVIDWRDGVYAPAGVNAYPLLFKSPITLDPSAFDSGAADITPSVWAGRLHEFPVNIVAGEHAGPLVYRKSCVDLTRLDQPEALAVFWSYVAKVPRLRRHMARDPRFRGKSDREIMFSYLTRYFTPNDRVTAAVEAALAPLPRPIIGAHLRYTDMAGPLDAVKSSIAKLRAKQPDAPIFLATDSAKAQADITATFGNLHVTEKYLPEDGKHLHGVQNSAVDPVLEAENAMIDMWALARCDHLIYSKNSTFSGTSALIGGLREAQLINVDRFNPRIMAKRFLQDFL